jgi:hypothetical protein
MVLVVDHTLVMVSFSHGAEQDGDRGAHVGAGVETR